MSLKGLEESEKLANGLNTSIRKSLAKQSNILKEEISKIEALLEDKEQLKKWRSGLVSSDRLASLYNQMNEVERLYIEAGNTKAAKIFKKRTEAELKQRLTNLKANQLEVKIRAEHFKAEVAPKTLEKLNEVRQDAILREMYQQSRNAGGFLSNFGRSYMGDLVTLETKAAGSKTLGDYMSKLFISYEQGLKNVFVNGIIRGDSYKTMAQNLQKTTGITAGKAKLLVNTEANAIFNDGVKKVIEHNPLVKGYRFRAVLDSRTSKICQEHDGKFIPKDDIKPGINYPPLHPNCRSTVTTVLANENERLDTVQRFTKNGKNQWEKVPPGMTYLEYKDKFGFSNSKNPKTYNPATRDIHDATLARVGPNIYKGYVKPSASSTARIEKMVSAYIDGDNTYIDTIKENTGYSQPDKALFRQAQAEAGFDGLPLRMNDTAFEREVESKDLKVVYRQFKTEEDKKQFLEGTMPYGTGGTIYGPGTYTFEAEPTDNLHGNITVKMALKSDQSKILDMSRSIISDSQGEIAEAMTPDERINAVLRKATRDQRKQLLSTLAVEYGYDAMKVVTPSNGFYYVVLNRTAVVVKGD